MLSAALHLSLPPPPPPSLPEQLRKPLPIVLVQTGIGLAWSSRPLNGARGSAQQNFCHVFMSTQLKPFSWRSHFFAARCLCAQILLLRHVLLSLKFSFALEFAVPFQCVTIFAVFLPLHEWVVCVCVCVCTALYLRTYLLIHTNNQLTHSYTYIRMHITGRRRFWSGSNEETPKWRGQRTKCKLREGASQLSFAVNREGRESSFRWR